MRSLKLLICPMIALLALLLFSCGPKTPEEAVAQARAKYIVKLNTFQVVKPAVDETMDGETMDGEAMDGEAMDGETMDGEAMDGEAMDGEAMDGEAMDGEAAEGEAMTGEAPETTEILLDLLVAFSGRKSLQGITIEISHADPFEKEKATYRRYLETGTVLAGDSIQLVETLELDNFEIGDVFSVSVRPVVPPEEQSEYREFSEYTP